MRRNLSPGIIASAVLVLAATNVTSAQSEDDPFFDFNPDLRTAVVLNANTDATVNSAIDAAAANAHEAIRQNRNDKKKGDGYSVEIEPDRNSVVLRAQELALANDLVIIDGGSSDRSIGFAPRNQLTQFIDLAQPVPCVDELGRFDATGECLGLDTTLPLNYSVVTFEVEDPAYLAGVIAASASRNDRLGIISGMRDCGECNRYIQGFILGAQSVEPEIAIEVAYLADDDEGLAFGDPSTARAFAEAFIDVNQLDVVMPVAREASIGIIEAADAAGILVVGTDGDVAALHPEFAESVLTSVTRDVGRAVRHAMFESSTELTPRARQANLAEGFVGLTDDWATRTLPVGVTDLYNDALNSLLTGTVDACPSSCGQPYGPSGSEEPVATDAATDATAPEVAPQASEPPPGE